jgi:hypothetical protein
MISKRLLIATLFGIISGFICTWLASSGGNQLGLMLALNIILGRTMIGVAIGISNLKLKHWAIHGAVMGFVFGLPSAFGSVLGPETPEFPHTMMFIWTFVMGIIYGVFIEFFTSFVFRAKQV